MKDLVIADSDVDFSGRLAGHVRFVRRGDAVLYDWTRPDGKVEWASFGDIDQCAMGFMDRLIEHYARMH